MPDPDVDLPELEPDEAVEDVDEYECFDVQAWAEAYRADTQAQAEYARLAGVPFN